MSLPDNYWMAKWEDRHWAYSVDVIDKTLFKAIRLLGHTGTPPTPYYKELWVSEWVTALDKIDVGQIMAQVEKYKGDWGKIENYLNAVG
jgi:hypothetical protein